MPDRHQPDITAYGFAIAELLELHEGIPASNANLIVLHHASLVAKAWAEGLDCYTAKARLWSAWTRNLRRPPWA